MKWGTFIAIDSVTRKVRGANQTQMVMEDYMFQQAVKDPKDLIGPFETMIYDNDKSARSWSDEKLHAEALKAARAEQVKIAERLQGERDRLNKLDKQMSLAEHCSRESGHPIGSVALTKYINRHYGHG